MPLWNSRWLQIDRVRQERRLREKGKGRFENFENAAIPHQGLTAFFFLNPIWNIASFLS